MRGLIGRLLNSGLFQVTGVFAMTCPCHLGRKCQAPGRNLLESPCRLLGGSRFLPLDEGPPQGVRCCSLHYLGDPDIGSPKRGHSASLLYLEVRR